VLAPFDSATALLAQLARPDGDLDHKDDLYAALVRVVQARAPCSRLAHALLWCGLWPGLDRVYRRQLGDFGADTDELTEAISVAFTMLVGRMDLTRVHRVAATLVWSTNRDVTEERRRTLTELARCAGQPRRRVAATSAAAPGTDVAGPDGLSFAGELAAMRARLASEIGADADLVLAVVVLGMDQHEAAKRLGVTHDAARKRFQRALRRIRAQLAPSGEQLVSVDLPAAGTVDSD
jgi:RNA polymerase sigma-70 factor (ECF subfamily)